MSKTALKSDPAKRDNNIDFYVTNSMTAVSLPSVYCRSKSAKSETYPQAPQAQNTWCMRQLVYIENCMGK